MRKYIAIAVLSLLATLASAQTPVYCRPDVIKAMGTIWMMTSNGTTMYEATFILNGTPDAYNIEIEKSHNETGSQTIHTRSNTFAIFHVHPNVSGEFPSTPTNNYTGNGSGDTGVADRLSVDIYVVSNRGLTVYYPSTKATKKLREKFDWTSIKNCK